MPARVILQDFTGVPAVVDLAALRDAMVALGGDPEKVNPLVQSDLVIDHSVQVDFSGRIHGALQKNMDKEYGRNRERYEFLKWGQLSLGNFRVVPPGRGIVHQVNLEWVATVAHHRDEDGKPVYYPDTLVGTDSHTTMIERPRRPRLGRRRHRGRGGDARPAGLHARPRRGGLQAHGPALPGRDRHRHDPAHRPDAPGEGRGREVRGVLRARPGEALAGRPGHRGQHGPRVRRHLRLLPGGPGHPRLPEDDRPRRRPRGQRRDLLQGPGPLPHRQEPRARVHRRPRARSGHRASGARRPQASPGPHRPRRT